MKLCETCKNNNCNRQVVIIEEDNLKTVKCLDYQKDESKIQRYKKPLEKTAKLNKCVIPGLISDWSNL